MTSRTYACKVDNGVVVQVLVGSASWANENLGGFWVDSESKVGLGWLWNSEYGLRPDDSESVE